MFVGKKCLAGSNEGGSKQRSRSGATEASIGSPLKQWLPFTNTISTNCLNGEFQTTRCSRPTFSIAFHQNTRVDNSCWRSAATSGKERHSPRYRRATTTLDRARRVTMTFSTLEVTRMRQSVCPQCGHTVDTKPRTRWVETGLGILGTVALALILVPLGIMAWKSCTNFLSDRASHSILFQPLEDWTRY